MFIERKRKQAAKKNCRIVNTKVCDGICRANFEQNEVSKMVWWHAGCDPPDECHALPEYSKEEKFQPGLNNISELHIADTPFFQGG